MASSNKIRYDLQVGDLGRLIALHGEVYDALPGYGVRFEAYVARTIAEYVIDAGGEGRIWLAERDSDLVGCAAMVLREQGRGQLRWVLVDKSARGIGLGRELVDLALEYARTNDCSRVYLETTDGLAESQQLYESLGFEVISSTHEELWDGVRPLIQMELDLN